MQPLKVDTGNRLTASDGAAGVLLCTGGPASNFGPTDREQREDSAVHQKGIHTGRGGMSLQVDDEDAGHRRLKLVIFIFIIVILQNIQYKILK